MQLCDSHCHLESPRFAADRGAVIEHAIQAGVGLMVSCGSDIDTSRQQVTLAASYPGVYAAVGIHAHQAGTALVTANNATALNESAFLELGNLAGQYGVVALGELGLDYHYEFSPRAIQEQVLTRQLQLAMQLNLPVILHNRESDTDLMRIVSPFSVRGVLHCFLGSAELLDWAIERGLYIGVAGPITFPHMDHLMQIIRRTPIDRLLLETDSPYLAPQPVRGKRNEPAHVRLIADKVALVLGLQTESLAEITCRNTRKCFGINDVG